MPEETVLSSEMLNLLSEVSFISKNNVLFFQILTNARWTTGAVRVTAATPLAATTASVLRGAAWGQMARPVGVRRTAGKWPECTDSSGVQKVLGSFGIS